jgi:hypothetical protein
MVEFLPSKHEALSPNPSTAKRKQKGPRRPVELYNPLLTLEVHQKPQDEGPQSGPGSQASVAQLFPFYSNSTLEEKTMGSNWIRKRCKRCNPGVR